MKNYIILFILFLFSSAANAQNIAYVDSDLILSKMPEYISAQKQLDDITGKFQAKASQMQTDLDMLFKAYQVEQYILTEAEKETKQKQIVEKEAELFKFREDKFGQNGEVFKKREELIKPVQDKVFAAVQKVAKKRGYKIVLDKAGGILMLYADDSLDKTDEVLEELGIVTKSETPEVPKN